MTAFALVGELDELVHLVAHAPLEDLDLFEDDTVLDASIDEIACIRTAGWTVRVAEGCRGRCMLGEGRGGRGEGAVRCQQDEGVDIGEKCVRFEGDQRYACARGEVLCGSACGKG
jgi:hypothetical protein